MKQVFFIEVTEEIGRRFFYVGEETAEAATATLTSSNPEFLGEENRFVLYSLQPAQVPFVTQGTVVEWAVDMPISFQMVLDLIKHINRKE